MNSNNIVLISLMILLLSNNNLSHVSLFLLLGFLAATGNCDLFNTNNTANTQTN